MMLCQHESLELCLHHYVELNVIFKCLDLLTPYNLKKNYVLSYCNSSFGLLPAFINVLFHGNNCSL